MTPEFRARAVVNFFVERGILPQSAVSIALTEGIELAIAAAVADEREACAKAVESFGLRSCDDAPGVVREAAAAIRSRGG